jgi:hypothetical protein
LAENVGLGGAQAMVTVEKVNLNRKIRLGPVTKEPRIDLMDDQAASIA